MLSEEYLEIQPQDFKDAVIAQSSLVLPATVDSLRRL